MIGRVPSELPRNPEVADQFDLLADLMEIDGADSFRIAAYRRAATSIRESAANVAQLALEGKATALPGVGKTIQDKIGELVADGEVHALTKRKLAVPVGLVELLRIPGLGPKSVRRVWKELGIVDLTGLKAAAEQQQLRALSGLGAKAEERILAYAPAAADGPAGDGRTLLGTALPAALAVVSTLADQLGADLVSEGGSLRRRRETVRDLDVIAGADDPAAVTADFVARPWVVEVAAKGDTKATVVSADGLRFDLRVVPPDCFGNLLQHFTGSKQHNVALREDAVRRGLSISEYGVTHVESGKVFTTRSEHELYEHLGYQFVPPELRENSGEIAAARRGEIPELVEITDLKGDLHSHSTWSDGRASIAEMALAALARGYTYLAMTDHSQRLRGDILERQWDEIDRLNADLAPFRLLKGIEVNIRANGELDVEDDLLATFDWVVASLHSSFDTSPTERILAAMDNPHVDVIGHATTRRINKREPANVAIETIVERAVATGTAVEINSQPDRLDLRDVHARLAGEAGASIVVSSDAHRTDALAYVEIGVAQARRAWLTSKQVLNTRPWPDIQPKTTRR
jgi:DNA polymerase (family 10)